jgi:hypothetical protein
MQQQLQILGLRAAAFELPWLPAWPLLRQMGAELITQCIHTGLLNFEKVGGRKKIYPGAAGLIPTYTPLPLHSIGRSSGEAKLLEVLNEIFTKELVKFQVRLRDLTQCPYDFGIFSPNGDLLGLIEVDGEQHRRRIQYFNNSNGMTFARRQQIDQIKQVHADTDGVKFLRINANLSKAEMRTEVLAWQSQF